MEYRIRQEALCFGGGTTTATDIAIAAGVAPRTICTTPEALSALAPEVVYATMREIKKMLETAIDRMKVAVTESNKLCFVIPFLFFLTSD